MQRQDAVMPPSVESAMPVSVSRNAALCVPAEDPALREGASSSGGRREGQEKRERQEGGKDRGREIEAETREGGGVKTGGGMTGAHGRVRDEGEER